MIYAKEEGINYLKQARQAIFSLTGRVGEVTN